MRFRRIRVSAVHGVLAVSLLAAFVAVATPAGAATLVVTRSDDPPPDACNPGDCSLREAVRAANVAADMDTIVLSAGTYKLTQAGPNDQDALANDLDIHHSVTILGAEHGRTVIDAMGAVTGNRVFHVPGPEASDPTFTMSNLTLTGGVSAGVGGGIAQDEGSMALSDMTIAGNTDPFFHGGGLAFFGTATLTNVTVTGNSADEYGGGIYLGGGALELNNVTVTGNTADPDGSGEDGGGIAVRYGAVLTIRNSLIAGNTDGSAVGDNAPDCFQELATLSSAGHNLIGSTEGCSFTPGPGDLFGVDPLIGPLADNGGPAMTHALRKGSPAIDAGGTDCAATDQRGLPRNCDIGAYELVLCQKVAVNRIGTEGNDELTGTSGPDGLLGSGGKDNLSAKGGKDGLCGGPGKDKLKGGGGKDRLDGGTGKDTCIGQSGRDKARACEKEKSI